MGTRSRTPARNRPRRSRRREEGENRPRLGLALGGGGARGYAHLGVLRALDRAGIPVDAVAGTSMGAVIGGAYAGGVDLTKLEEVLKRLDLNKLLGFPHSSVWGVLGNTAAELFTKLDWRRADPESTQALVEFFELFTRGQEFADLKIPFAVVTADIDTGEEVVLTEGSLGRAMAAGVAIPGIHYPVEIDGRFLVDGGLVNRVPADVAFSLLGADRVIAVDVSAELYTEEPTSSFEVLLQAESILLRELTRLQLALAKERYGDRLLILRPAVQHIKALSLEEVEGPARAGEIETERLLPEIRSWLEMSAWAL